MAATAFPAEIIQRIVEMIFADKTRDDGVIDETGGLPKDFLKLATISKAFVYPVRRAIYEDLHIEGGERFLMMTSQLRFCPHLAHFVRTARLTSTCKQLTDIDGLYFGSRTPTPFLISDLPVVWFLDACPRLHEVSVSGPDFIAALSSRPVAQCRGILRIDSVQVISCSHDACESLLPPGWLGPLMRFPALKELSLFGYSIDHASDAVPIGSSSCTSLDICTVDRVHPDGVYTLVRACRRLEELHLEIPAFAPGGLQRVLFPVLKTLRTLVISDYSPSNVSTARELETAIPRVSNLEVLAINEIPVHENLLQCLPPALKHLRLSCLENLPAPVFIKWLRKSRHRSLRILELHGMLKRTMQSTVQAKDRATPEQTAQIQALCAQRGLEWRHSEGWFDEDEDDDGGLFYMPQELE